MRKIILTTTKKELKAGTKTVFVTVSTETQEVTREQHRNATEDGTVKYFRRLGGSETVERGYTSQGYNVVKLTSTDPSRTKKTIREYDFDSEE